MFSAILTSRIKDNGDSNLPLLLQTIQERSSDFTNFEVLIKFDNDDYQAAALAKGFSRYPFRINHIFDHRGRGANDMHIGYTSLLSITNDKSEFFVTLSDDFAVQHEWDKTLLASLSTMGQDGTPFEKWEMERLDGMNDPFIIQYLPHPGGTMQNKYNLNWDAKNIENITGLEIAPAFSRKLIELCGGFGHVSFTDAWIILLQHELCNSHNLNITRFTNKEYAKRLAQGVGMTVLEQANRDGQRKLNFKQINSNWYERLLIAQGQVVADYYLKYRKSDLETKWKNKELSISRTIEAPRHGEIITNSK